jgi:hypothetical protein
LAMVSDLKSNSMRANINSPLLLAEGFNKFEGFGHRFRTHTFQHY